MAVGIRRLVGGLVVKDQMDIAPRWHSLVDTAKEFQELLGPPLVVRGKPLPGNGWRGRHSPITFPDFTSSAANSVVVPCRL